MNCHRNVGVDRPAIQKLSKAYEKGYSIPWLKVHLLPDFVMFNHQPHVEAGVRCQKCHGPIEEMKEVHQQEDLSMGWCVQCHRNPEAARDLGWDKKKDIKEVTQQAPTSCGTCHY
ncbi:MAG: cytochrome c3 family protein [Bdellovibrionales bacterium]|nr:cytochrome c3 family protein [Bdellovibrionales bacterium]